MGNLGGNGPGDGGGGRGPGGRGPGGGGGSGGGSGGGGRGDGNGRGGRNRLTPLERYVKDVEKGQKAFKEIFSSLFGMLKAFKFVGIEIAAMSATFLAFKVAVVSVNFVMKALRASITALGAAAGVAIGAVAGFLGSQREYNAAKMRPLITKVAGPQSGTQSALGRMQQFYGDAQLGGFGEQALSGILSKQLQSGGQVNGAYRAQLTRYADYAMGDPKVLAEIASAMSEAQKEGKITSGVYEQLTKASPALAEAFKEMAGDQKKADAAGRAGKMTFEAFNQVLMDGKLKALEPYNGALEAINNTVIGRFKTGLASIKEQLTSLGLGSYKELYGDRAPYASTTGEGRGASIVDATRQQVVNLQSTIQKTIMAIGPQIQMMMPDLINRLGGPMNQVSEMIVRLVIRGMSALDNFSPNINRWIGQFRTFFSQVMGYMKNMAAKWDVLWKTFWKPIVSALGNVVKFIVGRWAKSVDKASNQYKILGQELVEVIDTIKLVIDAFMNYSEVFTGVLSTFLRFVNLFTKFFKLPVVRTFTVWGIAFLLVAAGVRKIEFAAIKAAAAFGKWTLAIRQTNTALTTTGATGGARTMGWGGWAGAGVMAGGMAAMMGGQYLQNKSESADRFGQTTGGFMSGAGMAAMMASPAMLVPVAGPWIVGGAAVLGGAAGGVSGFMGAGKAHGQEIERSKAATEGSVYEGQYQRPKDIEAAQKRMAKKRKLVDKLNKVTNDVNKREAQANAEMGNALFGNFVSAGFGVYDKFLNAGLKDAKKERDALEKKLGVESGKGADEQLRKIEKRINKERGLTLANRTLARAVGLSADEVVAWADKNGKKLNKAELKLKDFIKAVGYGRSEAEDRGVAATRNLENLRPTENLRVKESQASLDAANALTAYLEAAKAGLGVDAGRVEADKALRSTMAYQTASYSANHYPNYEDFAVSTGRELMKTIDTAKEFGVAGDALQTLSEEVWYTVARLNAGLTQFKERSELDPKFLQEVGGQIEGYIATLSPEEIAKKGGKVVMEEGVNYVKTWLDQHQIKLNGQEDTNFLQAMIAQQLQNSGMLAAAAMQKGGKAAADELWAVLSGSFWVMTSNGLEFKGSRTNPNAAPPAGPQGLNGGPTGIVDRTGGVRQFDDTQARVAYAIEQARIEAAKAQGEDLVGDTMTSRFARTMARHSAINSMISGRRTITSGVRNYNLGSPSSDHLTGAAYDLTGQNLGAYAGLVRASGGFAEFHGGALNRHLHVVPGMGIGDTSTPISMGTSSGAAVVNNNYSIVVNAPEGSSPQAIADAVMARIAARQRDAMERR